METLQVSEIEKLTSPINETVRLGKSTCDENSMGNNSPKNVGSFGVVLKGGEIGGCGSDHGTSATPLVTNPSMHGPVHMEDVANGKLVVSAEVSETTKKGTGNWKRAARQKGKISSAQGKKNEGSNGKRKSMTEDEVYDDLKIRRTSGTTSNLMISAEAVEQPRRDQ